MKIFRILLICCILFPGLLPASQRAAASALWIDDFEAVDDWRGGLTLETAVVHNGTGAGRWQDHPEHTSIWKAFSPALDASRMNFFECWLYSGKANGAQVMLVLDSQNEADPAGSDYYAYEIDVTWAGWRRLHIPLEDFIVARSPLGWQEIQAVSLNASGWGHTPQPDTLLLLDEMRFGSGVIAGSRHTAAYDGADFLYTYTLDLQERLGTARSLSLRAEQPDDYPFEITFQPATLDLPANGSAQANVLVRIPAAQITAATRLQEHSANVIVIENGSEVDARTVEAAIPLPASDALPRLLMNAADRARIDAWVAAEAWANSARAGILEAANGWPASFTEKYYQAAWALPPEGGQWGAWYICPQGGANLRYEGPGRHVCPLDNEVYSGWPYEQVIYARMHSDLASFASTLGLAYQFSGDNSYAQSAAEILLAYADIYRAYPLHDVNGQPKLSGGHVTAQTLDESMWLVPIAWAYDLIADSGALSATQRNHIEQDLLYAAATTIGSNPRGVSNWQSWHNAAIGAVGFALQDPLLIAQAIHDPANGFAFQMQASVSADGFWYEGSWGYHVFALQAHRYLAEMAARSGIDLYGSAKLHKMFTAPLQFAMPDLSLPPFNDSGSINLANYRDLYESAYQRYGETWLAAPLLTRSRGREALLWGAQHLPSAAAFETPSMLFLESGYAVLRNNEGEYPFYLALDFGPHGGGHGHYDKLGFVSFGRNGMFGIDPGTQSYAAPTHDTWDKATIAHNTMAVDENVQAEAAGSLQQFLGLPGLSVASAEAGEAYPTARLERTLVVSRDYTLAHDRAQATDGQIHAIDWIYHNPGTLTTGLPLAAYAGFPTQNGYQHLEDTRAATTATDWQGRFEMNEDPNRPYGAVWPSVSGITATFAYNDQQAASGSGSGKLTYDFSAATGYVLYSTLSPEPGEEVPLGLKIAVYGDNSGNQLSLRLYDHSDERFVKAVGPIDWNGWRVLSFADLAAWQHFLGNDDGVFDLPVKQAAIQVSHQSGAAPQGTLYVDDIQLLHASENRLVEDFETLVRRLDVWMLGAPDTTVVTGNGLGPTLSVPVPFVMARRNAAATTFAALLAPHGTTPAIEGFATLPSDATPAEQAASYVITATTYVDRLFTLPDGMPGIPHTFGTASCDGQTCLLRQDAEGHLQRLILANGSQIEADGLSLLHTDSPLSGIQVDYEGTTLRIESLSARRAAIFIWGPAITQVTWNGAPCTFRREGEYVVLAASQLLWLPVVVR
ncbi:MAG: heparinase II/III domain-containing protein [Chloroflexota bacterium]